MLLTWRRKCPPNLVLSSESRTCCAGIRAVQGVPLTIRRVPNDAVVARKQGDRRGAVARDGIDRFQENPDGTRRREIVRELLPLSRQVEVPAAALQRYRLRSPAEQVDSGIAEYIDGPRWRVQIEEGDGIGCVPIIGTDRTPILFQIAMF